MVRSYLYRCHADERGVFLPLALLLSGILFAFIGLSAYSTYTNAKRAEARLLAETVALAAAKELCSSDKCIESARAVAYTLLKQHNAIVDVARDIQIGRVFTDESSPTNLSFQSLEDYKTNRRGMIQPIISNGVSVQANIPIFGLTALGTMKVNASVISGVAVATRSNPDALSEGIEVLPMGIPLCWLLDYNQRLNPQLLNGVNRYIVATPDRYDVNYGNMAETQLLNRWTDRLSCVDQSPESNPREVDLDINRVFKSQMYRLRKSYVDHYSGYNNNRFRPSSLAIASRNDFTRADTYVSSQYFSPYAPTLVYENSHDNPVPEYMNTDELGIFIKNCDGRWHEPGVEAESGFHAYLGQTVCASPGIPMQTAATIVDILNKNVLEIEDSDPAGDSGTVTLGYPSSWMNIKPNEAPCNSQVLTKALSLITRNYDMTYKDFNATYRSLLLPGGPQPIFTGYRQECHDETEPECEMVPKPGCKDEDHPEMVEKCRDVTKSVCVDVPVYRNPFDNEIAAQIAERVKENNPNQLQRLLSIAARAGVSITVPIIAKDGNEDACYGGISKFDPDNPKAYGDSAMMTASSNYRVVGYLPAWLYDIDAGDYQTSSDSDGDGFADAPSCNTARLRLKIDTQNPRLHVASNTIPNTSGRGEVFLVNAPVYGQPDRHVCNYYDTPVCYDPDAQPSDDCKEAAETPSVD